MFHLKGPQMLQMLEKSLRKSLPESLKEDTLSPCQEEEVEAQLHDLTKKTQIVYGTIFHMNQGNPFKLQALVDKWPDFNTVVVRPCEQEMTDDFDHYTNTYQIYSKDPSNCQELLDTSEVINWKQHLQIQSTQSSLDEVIQNIAARKLVKVKQTQCLLYMTPETAKKLIPSFLESKNLYLESVQLKALNQEMFKHSSLDVTHAALVDRFWSFGGNERSQRFIERLIRTFPTLCLMGPEGIPVAWSLMDQSGEVRMGGTVPKYRAQGLSSYVLYSHVQSLEELGFPTYIHTNRANKIIQKMSHTLQHVPLPCDWNQWNCVPLWSQP